MTIGIYVNESKDIGLTIANKIAGAVSERGGNAVLAAGGGYEGLSQCDVIICIGGDGTLIRAARETLAYGRPLLGVNLGSLGYLTEVETSQIESILDRVFVHDYRIEERMMLTVERQCAVETVLNELYIGRGESPHVVRLKIYINETFLDVYPGDGILISTPTGATAYALSAGGPVIDPELQLISIVPVCPHVIFSRPVLVTPDKEITIIPAPSDSAFNASVSVDGFSRGVMREGEVFKVRRSSYTTKMLRFNTDNFYVVLKNKLFQTSGKFGPDENRWEAPTNGDSI